MCNAFVCGSEVEFLPDRLCTRSPVRSSTNMSEGKCVQQWVLMRACVRMYVYVCMLACLLTCVCV